MGQALDPCAMLGVPALSRGAERIRREDLRESPAQLALTGARGWFKSKGPAS